MKFDGFEMKLEYVWIIVEVIILYWVWKNTMDFRYVLTIKAGSTLLLEIETHRELLLSPKRILWHSLAIICYSLAFLLKQEGYYGPWLFVTGWSAMSGYLLMEIGAFHSHSPFNRVKWE